MNPLYQKHIISINDLSREELELVLDTAAKLKANPQPELLKHKVIASCFFEASTRTRLSFETSMHRLGASVVGFSDSSNTSLGKKGETLADTISVISTYVDAIVMRHPQEGAARLATEFSGGIPILNAGDGANQHPTQTLLDLFTIQETQGQLENLNIAMVGDLKYGRTVHSLIKALSRYSNIKVILIAPQELRLPDYMLAEMAENSHLEFREVETMEEVMPELDILYMTRVQKERFLDEEEFDRVKNSFVLNPEKLKTAKEDMIILHPLPRVNEITRAVDNDPRAAYFRQVENGKFVRMALIYTLLRWADENRPFERTPVFSERYVVNEYECPNRRCISATEDVDRLFHRQADGTCRCAYCEAKAR